MERIQVTGSQREEYFMLHRKQNPTLSGRFIMNLGNICHTAHGITNDDGNHDIRSLRPNEKPKSAKRGVRNEQVGIPSSSINRCWVWSRGMRDPTDRTTGDSSRSEKLFGIDVLDLEGEWWTRRPASLTLFRRMGDSS